MLEDNGLSSNDRIVIRDRKIELIGDLVSMNSIISDDINNIDSDIYLMTHTTNPFLSSKSIVDALNLFQQKKNSVPQRKNELSPNRKHLNVFMFQ